MTSESTQTAPRSRRALLAGAIGGLGVWAASAIGRAAPAEAAAGDPIRMGRLNKAAGTSTTVQTDSSQPTFRAVQLAGGNALRGEATNGRGVVGISGPNGTGLWGYSPDHVAVRATCDTGIAVDAASSEGIVINAIAGQSATGVYATAGTTGWAAIFDGHVSIFHSVIGSFEDFVEHFPSAPPINTARLFARDNGSGKTQLCVQFPTGAVQVLATEP